MKDWYKEFHGVSGIYAIENTENGKIYVGQAQDIWKRWTNGHLFQLRQGTHKNVHLQAAWSKYGESAFRFICLERGVPLNLLDEKETYWIREFDTYKSGYNRAPEGGSNRGLKASQETKAKLSAAQRLSLERDPGLNVKRGMSRSRAYAENPEMRVRQSENTKRYFEKPESRQKHSESSRKVYENNPGQRKKMSEIAKAAYDRDPELRARLSDSVTRAYREDPTLRRRVAEGKRKDSKLTQATVDEMRARYVPRCKTNGVTALAKEFGVSISHVCGILKGRAWVL